MSTIDWNKLKEPFPAHDIEWRLQSCGKTSNGKIWAICLAYVTNRAIQNRLDEVFTPGGWQNRFESGPHGGVVCGLSAKIESEWVTKWDGAENTQVEAVKGGLSDAMKRAGYQWGIGRYLYNLEEGFATISDSGDYRGRTKDGTDFKWSPPKLPEWALPGGSGTPSAVPSKTTAKEKPAKTAPPADTGSKSAAQKLIDELSEWCHKDEVLMAEALKQHSEFNEKHLSLDRVRNADKAPADQKDRLMKWCGATLNKVREARQKVELCNECRQPMVNGVCKTTSCPNAEP